MKVVKNQLVMIVVANRDVRFVEYFNNYEKR